MPWPSILDSFPKYLCMSRPPSAQQMLSTENNGHDKQKFVPVLHAKEPMAVSTAKHMCWVWTQVCVCVCVCVSGSRSVVPAWLWVQLWVHWRAGVWRCQRVARTFQEVCGPRYSTSCWTDRSAVWCAERWVHPASTWNRHKKLPWLHQTESLGTALCPFHGPFDACWTKWKVLVTITSSRMTGLFFFMV